MAIPLPLLPHHNRVVSIWLLTIVIGSLCVTGCIILLGHKAPDLRALAYFFAALCLLAGVFSSPALLVLPPCIRWALHKPDFRSRRFRLFLVIEGVSSVVAGGIFLLVKLLMNGPRNTNVLWFMVPYAVVALLVANRRYASWLFPVCSQS